MYNFINFTSIVSFGFIKKVLIKVFYNNSYILALYFNTNPGSKRENNIVNRLTIFNL